jgi:hypothetical protein
LKYRFAGKEKLLSLGVHPEISIRDARDRRDVARKLLLNGINPSIDREVQNAANAEREQLRACGAGVVRKVFTQVGARGISTEYGSGTALANRIDALINGERGPVAYSSWYASWVNGEPRATTWWVVVSVSVMVCTWSSVTDTLNGSPNASVPKKRMITSEVAVGLLLPTRVGADGYLTPLRRDSLTQLHGPQIVAGQGF